MKSKRFASFSALAGIFITCSLHAQDGTWNVDADGNWNDAVNWLGSITADGPGSSALFTFDITDNRTVTLGEDRTIGNITFTDATSSNNLAISGVNILTLAGTTPSVNVTQAGRTLTIASEIAGTSGLTKSGAGILAFNGSAVNTFTGGLNVGAGTLSLDYSNLATPADLIDSGNALTLGGGATLALTGQDSATNTTQTFNGTTLELGQNTLSLAKGATATAATLNLGALTTSAGSITTIITGTAGGTTWATGVTPASEIINITSYNSNALPASGKVNVNAGLFYRQNTNAGAARWVSVDSAGQLQALPAGLVAIAAGTNDSLNAYALNSGGTTTLTNTDASIYGLVLNQSSTGRILALAADGTLTLNGIIGVQASNTAAINAGTGTSNLIIGSERNLVINMDNGGGTNGGSLTINAPIANNSSIGGVGGTASSVTIASTMPTGAPGAVILSGDNTFSGGLIQAGRGVVRLNHSNAAGTGTITLASTQTGTASTLVIATGINVANPIEIQAELGRNTITSTEGDNSLSGDITINNNSGNIIIFQNSGASGTTFTVGGATPNSTTITAESFGGQISFRASTNTTRLGVLNSQVNAPNADFNGNVQGNWTINSTGNIWKTTSLSSASRFVLGATDALATGANVTLNGSGFIDLNGYNQTVAGLGGSSATGSILNNSATTDSTLTIAGLSADRNFIGAIVDGSTTNKVSLVVNNANAFTQTLSGTNTYTGDTTVSAGTLYVTGALSNSAVTVEANGVIGGTGDLGNGLAFAANSFLEVVDLNDALTVTGTISFGSGFGIANLLGVDWDTLDTNTAYTVLSTDQIFGELDIANFGFDNRVAVGLSDREAYFTNGSLAFIIIPEPSTALLGAISLLALFRRRR